MFWFHSKKEHPVLNKCPLTKAGDVGQDVLSGKRQERPWESKKPDKKADFLGDARTIRHKLGAMPSLNEQISVRPILILSLEKIL
jgi:hypothetical protein